MITDWVSHHSLGQPSLTRSHAGQSQAGEDSTPPPTRRLPALPHRVTRIPAADEPLGRQLEIRPGSAALCRRARKWGLG